MAIFNSYVSLPEGKYAVNGTFWKLVKEVMIFSTGDRPLDVLEKRRHVDKNNLFAGRLWDAGTRAQEQGHRYNMV